MEIKQNTQKENISLKMKKEQIFMVIFCLFLIFVGFMVGLSINNVNERFDYKVYLEQEEQVFRNSDGKKLCPIEVNNQIYIPITGTGSFLNYMTVLESGSNELYLYEIENENMTKNINGFNTESIDGISVTDDILKESEYTMFFIWATWCPDCEEELQELKGINDYFVENKIQIISLPTDLGLLQNKEETTQDLKSKILSATDGIDIKHHLFRDSVLNSCLIGNSVYIPTLVIYDNQGNMVKKIEHNVTGAEIIDVFEKIM